MRVSFSIEARGFNNWCAVLSYLRETCWKSAVSMGFPLCFRWREILFFHRVLSLSLSLSLFLSVCVSLSLSLCLFVCLFVCLSLNLWKIINWIDWGNLERILYMYWLFTQAEISYPYNNYDPFFWPEFFFFLLRELVPDSMTRKLEVSSAVNFAG